MIYGTFQSNDFWPLQLPFENLGVHGDSNSQSGSSLESVGVHSLTLFCTFGNMKGDSWVHFWLTPLQALTLVVSPRLGLRHAWDNNVITNLNYISNSLSYRSILCIFFYFQHGLLNYKFVKDIKLINLPRWNMCHLMAFPNANCASVNVTKTWHMLKSQEHAIPTRYTFDLNTLNEIILTLNLVLTHKIITRIMKKYF
jgi:hypothetical protein